MPAAGRVEVEPRAEHLPVHGAWLLGGEYAVNPGNRQSEFGSGRKAKFTAWR